MKLINTLSDTHNLRNAVGVAALCTILAACGDSDLTQIQLDAIAQAQEDAANAPPAPTVEQPAPANPGEEPAGPADPVDPVTNPFVNGSDVDELITGATVIFSDEFNGDAIDSTKWNTRYVWGADIIVNDEKQYYSDTLGDPDFGVDPFVFNGQTLSITAQSTPADKLTAANNQPYVSGVITSFDRFDFTYGYAEIRAKLPEGQGYWPGFWMLGSEFVDLKPQLYIMENRGHVNDTVYHRYNYSDANDEFVYSDLLPSVSASATDFSADFHTFGVSWSAGEIAYYVDGTKTHTIANGNISSQDMYLILNLAVGGWFPGSPDATTAFPGAFEIDYVRIYRR